MENGTFNHVPLAKHGSIATEMTAGRADSFDTASSPAAWNKGRFQGLFESAPDAMVVVDARGRIVQVNCQAEQLLGFPRDELLGHSVEVLVPERYRNVHNAFRQVFAAHPRFRSLTPGRDSFALAKDGSEIPVEITLSRFETSGEVFFCSSIRDARARKISEEIHLRLNFERTLSDLSATFINLPPEHVDEELAKGVRVLAEALDADRCLLGRVDAKTGDLLVTHAWSCAGFPAFPSKALNNTLPWLNRKIRQGEVVVVCRPEELPAEANVERHYMESLGVKSALIVPFVVGGKVIGGISIDGFRKQHNWDPVVISRFQHAAGIFANALARKRTDEELQGAYLQIKELKHRLERENLYLREEIKLKHSHSTVVGDSAAIRGVLLEAEQVAATDSTVLILGETGTGKELIARVIHKLSGRSNRLMVETNCAALPATLIESELFGREKGAYTGALSREVGRFELAGNSTIFLDEIGELPVELQAKLLRVLQEGTFERLGSSRTVHVNVRVIAATSRDLMAMVRDGRFREDLFYRLNVFPITIPPLRERLEDLPALVWHMLADLCKRMGKPIESVHSSTLERFREYSWPGNVRELRNVIEHHLILNKGPVFRADVPTMETSPSVPCRRLDEIERLHILNVLDKVHWRVRGPGGAAETLGLKPTTLEAKMKKLSIVRSD
jgi:PAS domain S-box-containing protein